MRGKVEPGALCLVIVGLWTGAVVRVVAKAPLPFQLMIERVFPGHHNWWEISVTDTVPRPVVNAGGASLGLSTYCFIVEKHLMPLDPDADVKAEPHEYGAPIGTREVFRIRLP